MPAGQRGLPLDQRRRADEGLLAVDLAPQVEQALDLALEVVLGDPFRHRADDHAPRVLGQVGGDHLPEPGAELLALDLAAHPHPGGVGHVDEEAAGEGDLRGHPAALGADGLLGDLDQEGLPLLEDVGDVRELAAGAAPRAGGAHGRRCPSRVLPVPRLPPGRRPSGAATVSASSNASSPSSPVRLLVFLRLEEIGGVEEGALLEAYINERGLNPGQDRFDLAEVDVADAAAMVRPVDEEFDQTVVLENGHAGFPLAPVDKNFALHAWHPRWDGSPPGRCDAPARPARSVKRQSGQGAHRSAPRAGTAPAAARWPSGARRQGNDYRRAAVRSGPGWRRPHSWTAMLAETANHGRNARSTSPFRKTKPDPT